MTEIEKSITNVISAKGTQVMANTSIIIKNGVTDVILYSTKIMSINYNKRTIKLNSGGYKTNITKSRMNTILGAIAPNRRVQQINNKWYIVGVRGDLTEFKDNMEIKF